MALGGSTFPNFRDLKGPRSHQTCPLNHSPQEKASWDTPSQLLRDCANENFQNRSNIHFTRAFLVDSVGSLISKEGRFLS